MGLDGSGLCAMLGGSVAGADCLWTTQFVGRLSRAVAAADTSGFVGDVFICVTPGRRSFRLGGDGGAFITAGVPSLGLGHVGGTAGSSCWCLL